MILSEMTNNNLLLGVMPEYLGLLVFGFALIGFAIVLRRFFGRQSESEKTEVFGKERIKSGN